MEIINATFYIKEEKRADFLAAVTPLLASARAEEGCHGAIISMNHWKRTIGLSWSKNGRIKKRLPPTIKTRCCNNYSNKCLTLQPNRARSLSLIKENKDDDFIDDFDCTGCLRVFLYSLFRNICHYVQSNSAGLQRDENRT